MKLLEQAWSSIAEIDKGKAVVVLPLGALEQHGLHLPLGVDSLLVQSLGESLEKALPDRTVLLPTQWLGHSPHHMAFAGTVSVTHPVYAELLEQIVASLVQAGFTKFMLLNGHGGNMLPVQMALQAIKIRFREHCELFVCGLNYWNISRQEMQEIRESEVGGMGHACEMETSMMLHLYPQYVDKSKIFRDGRQPDISWVTMDMLQSSPISVVYDFHEISQTGTFGDPTLATAEKGKQFMVATVQKLIGLASDISEL